MPPILTDVIDMWFGSLSQDLRRYVTFAVAVWLTLWVVFRVVIRPRKIREDTPPARQLVSEFLFSTRSIAVFSTVSVGMNLLDHAGAYPLQKIALSWGAPWFWISLIAMILAHDAYIYWTHRWMHHPKAFRTFHRRHHKSHNPSPFTAYSFDIAEALVNVAFVFAWPMIFPTPWPVIGLFMLHQIFRNTMLHCGYELMPARAAVAGLADHHHAPRPASRAGRRQLRRLVHLVGPLDGHGASGISGALCQSGLETTIPEAAGRGAFALRPYYLRA